MKGTYLRFYVHENRKHHGIPGVLHEQHFFELAGDLTVEVEFLVSDQHADMLLDVLRREHVRIFYARVPAEFGMLEGKD
jgi:hypothetical protein